MIRVMLFAGLAEITGSPTVIVETDKSTLSIAEVRAALVEKHPAIRDLLENSLAAVNQEYAEAEQIVTAADEIAFIPPVSGG